LVIARGPLGAACVAVPVPVFGAVCVVEDAAGLGVEFGAAEVCGNAVPGERLAIKRAAKSAADARNARG
jgi:hypothetical protein